MDVWNKLKMSRKVLAEEGIRAFFLKVYYYLNRKGNYRLWIAQNETDVMQAGKLEYNPLISIVVPVYDVEDALLEACIESVLQQSYTNYELCLVDDKSQMESVRVILRKYEENEKIKIVYREENGHISRATNSGIEVSTGDFIGLLDCDDLLAPNALYEVVRLLNQNPEYDYIYSDEDKITEDGKKRKDPFFKPDWSPDTIMSLMYTCHFSVFRKTLLEELEGMRPGLEGSQDYDLVLRVMEKTDKIGHIPKILYHWRERKESTAYDIESKSYILEATAKAKEDALVRRNLMGHLELVKSLAQYRIVYEPQENPLVSIIILSKDNCKMLQKCLESIQKYSDYKNYEIILVDNGSNEEQRKEYEQLSKEYRAEYVYRKMEFHFSKMCNLGAQRAKGSVFLFLNDDIEITQADWLYRLVGQAQLSHTGAVGVKLVYPDSNKIQHAGVLNLKTGPSHALYQMDDSTSYYFGRNVLDYNYCIVTGACLMIEKSKFLKAGGFDESFPIAYNDVELCFRLLEHGYYNVVRNDVKLIHHESISRGYDTEVPEKETRRRKEAERLYEMHPQFLGYDPCYNPNLVQTRGDFSFRLE